MKSAPVGAAEDTTGDDIKDTRNGECGGIYTLTFSVDDGSAMKGTHYTVRNDLIRSRFKGSQGLWRGDDFTSDPIGFQFLTFGTAEGAGDMDGDYKKDVSFTLNLDRIDVSEESANCTYSTGKNTATITICDKRRRGKRETFMNDQGHLETRLATCPKSALSQTDAMPDPEPETGEETENTNPSVTPATPSPPPVDPDPSESETEEEPETEEETETDDDGDETEEDTEEESEDMEEVMVSDGDGGCSVSGTPQTGTVALAQTLPVLVLLLFAVFIAPHGAGRSCHD